MSPSPFLASILTTCWCFYLHILFCQVMFVTSQTMVPHIKTMCKDPRVNVLGLEDSLIPESDNFMLGRVSRPRFFRGVGDESVNC